MQQFDPKRLYALTPATLAELERLIVAAHTRPGAGLRESAGANGHRVLSLASLGLPSDPPSSSSNTSSGHTSSTVSSSISSDSSGMDTTSSEEP